MWVPGSKHGKMTKILVPGTWYLVPEPDTRYLVPDTWYLVLGTWYLVLVTLLPSSVGFGIQPPGIPPPSCLSGFQPRTPLNPWVKPVPDMHPRNRGMPCCQPLGPTFLSPAGLRVGSHGMWVHPRAWLPGVPTQIGACTCLGTPPRVLCVKKSWSQGIPLWYHGIPLFRGC